MELKEVLHLYLGCPIKYAVIVPGQENSWETDVLNFRWLHGCLNNLVEVKAILRPLSDMTEEEMKECIKIGNPMYTGGGPKHWVIGWSAFSPQNFMYLLSRGFDLFDLINSNQAIDKTKGE